MVLFTELSEGRSITNKVVRFRKIIDTKHIKRTCFRSTALDPLQEPLYILTHVKRSAVKHEMFLLLSSNWFFFFFLIRTEKRKPFPKQQHPVNVWDIKAKAPIITLSLKHKHHSAFVFPTCDCFLYDFRSNVAGNYKFKYFSDKQ